MNWLQHYLVQSSPWINKTLTAMPFSQIPHYFADEVDIILLQYDCIRVYDVHHDEECELCCGRYGLRRGLHGSKPEAQRVSGQIG